METESLLLRSALVCFSNCKFHVHQMSQIFLCVELCKQVKFASSCFELFVVSIMQENVYTALALTLGLRVFS